MPQPRDNGKENGNYYRGVYIRLYRDNGKMEATILGLYWGYIVIMENKMETTILGLGFRGSRMLVVCLSLLFPLLVCFPLVARNE